MCNLGFQKLLIHILLLLCASLFSFDGYELVTGELPPYSYTKEGELKGVTIEIVLELQTRLKDTTPIVVEPWKRAIVNSTESRLTFPLARTEAREENYKWIGPLLTDHMIFVISSNDTTQMSSFDSFKDKKIGVNRGAPTEARLIAMGFSSIKPMSGEVLNLKKLTMGRIDAWYTTRLILNESLKILDISADKVNVSLVDLQLVQYIGVSKNVPDSVVSKWQQEVDKMKREGTLDSIISKYGISPNP